MSFFAVLLIIGFLIAWGNVGFLNTLAGFILGIFAGLVFGFGLTAFYCSIGEKGYLCEVNVIFFVPGVTILSWVIIAVNYARQSFKREVIVANKDFYKKAKRRKSKYPDFTDVVID